MGGGGGTCNLVRVAYLSRAASTAAGVFPVQTKRSLRLQSNQSKLAFTAGGGGKIFDSQQLQLGPQVWRSVVR